MKRGLERKRKGRKTTSVQGEQKKMEADVGGWGLNLPWTPCRQIFACPSPHLFGCHIPSQSSQSICPHVMPGINKLLSWQQNQTFLESTSRNNRTSQCILKSFFARSSRTNQSLIKSEGGRLQQVYKYVSCSGSQCSNSSTLITFNHNRNEKNKNGTWNPANSLCL